MNHHTVLLLASILVLRLTCSWSSVLTSLEMVVVIARVEHVGTVPQILLAPSTFILGLALLIPVLGVCSFCVIGAVADAFAVTSE